MIGNALAKGIANKIISKIPGLDTLLQVKSAFETLFVGKNNDANDNSQNLIKSFTTSIKNLWNKMLGFSNNYDVDQEEYKVEEKLLPENKYTRRKRRVDSDEKPEESIKAVVVHWTSVPNQTAEETWRYFSENEENERYASSHYIVGLKGEVIQAVPDEQAAFHSGGKKYTELAINKFNKKPNDYTIGIEIEPINSKGEFNTKTYTTAVRLTADLLVKYGLDVETGLLRHYDLTSKDCPKLFAGENNEAWKIFKSDVAKAMIRMK